MADNITLNSGSGGATLATDDIGGTHYQIVKLASGAADSATQVSDSAPLPVDDAGGSLTIDNATLSVTGGGTEASAMRVTIANDSTGVVSVDDNGGALSVDNAGTFAVQEDGAALTALQLIDDAVHARNGTFSKSAAVGGELDDTAPTAATEGNVSPARITAQRAFHVNLRDNSGSEVSPALESGGNLATLAGAVSGTEMQVDVVAALPAGTNAIGKLAANSGVDIGDVDVLSIVPGTGASNLGKAEDAVHTTGDVGVMALAVRQDSQADFGADGDYVPFSIDANGALRVTGGGGGTEYNEDDATPATIVGSAILMERDDALSSLTPIEGDWVGLRSNARGALWCELDLTNDVTIADGGNVISVDWNGTAPPIGAGTEAAALRVTLATDSTGVVSVDDNGGSITVDTAGGALDVSGATVTVDLGTNNDVQGATAHDAAVSGNPFLLAGEARTTTPTAVADGDVVRLQADDQGRLIVEPHAPRDLTTHNRISLTTTSETTLIAAGGAGVFHDMVMITLSNESASEVRVDIRDSTTGTIRFSMDLAADGGGAIVPFPVPLTQATANNNWTAELSGAVSTVYITGVAVKRV